MPEMTAASLFEKLWNAHLVAGLGERFALLYIDRIFLHERTGSIALKGLEEKNRVIRRAETVFCTMDHIVDTLPDRTDETLTEGGKSFIQATRKSCRAAGITLFDINDKRQGIVHVISPEQGVILPGLTLICPDSHTCTQGAFGALAWGVGSTEAEHAMATSTLRVEKPEIMRVTFTGQLGDGVTAKDMILFLIEKYTTAGARGYAVEFCGDTVRDLAMDARMTLCNMAVEFGAFTGLIAPDQKTFDYLAGRPYAPRGEKWQEALSHWQGLKSDEDAVFDKEITLNAGDIPPMVTWGTSPGQAIAVGDKIPDPALMRDYHQWKAAEKALGYMALDPGKAITDLAIDGAFIGSCTNSRISDLRRAATILKGRKVAPGVRAICVPGSSQVKAEAEKEGLDRIFLAAGFEWRQSGCSMCFFAGGESFGFQERVITTTNRNFESRQGLETRSHLASPETVAASAIMGRIATLRDLADETL